MLTTWLFPEVSLFWATSAEIPLKLAAWTWSGIFSNRIESLYCHCTWLPEGNGSKKVMETVFGDTLSFIEAAGAVDVEQIGQRVAKIFNPLLPPFLFSAIVPHWYGIGQQTPCWSGRRSPAQRAFRFSLLRTLKKWTHCFLCHYCCVLRPTEVFWDVDFKEL